MRTFGFAIAMGATALLIGTPLVFAETNTSTAADSSFAEQEAGWARHSAQSFEELQLQQQATLHAIEQARQDAEAAAKRNTEALEARLKQIEDSVAVQREHELETLRSSHHFTLMLVAVFAGVGFCGMLIVTLFLLRAMSRRMETTAAQPLGAPLGQSYAIALDAGETHLVAADPARQTSARLQRTLERMERRIHELEGSTEPAEPEAVEIPASAPSAEASGPAQAGESAGSPAPRPTSDRASRIALLLGKGQSLLHLQQTDTALACFEEVIALDPTHADAFVKKGGVLEKIGRLDEAIDCYDRAIALDTSMTMAYLSKGGVFNRLERYGEALQCYEQALRAQQKVGVP
jgi:tetratricopeptide (TPR) repeat protein